MAEVSGKDDFSVAVAEAIAGSANPLKENIFDGDAPAAKRPKTLKARFDVVTKDNIAILKRLNLTLFPVFKKLLVFILLIFC